MNWKNISKALIVTALAGIGVSIGVAVLKIPPPFDFFIGFFVGTGTFLFCYSVWDFLNE